LEAYAGGVFVGTQAGLMAVAREKAGWTLVRVADLPHEELRSLSVTPQGLALAFGSGQGLLLNGWRQKDARFAVVAEAASSTPSAGTPAVAHGFLLTSTLMHQGSLFETTYGGGLFVNGSATAGLPANLLGLRTFGGTLVAASNDALYVRGPEAWRPFAKNPCPDCRIACIAEFKGGIVAGTLAGGLIRWPSHEALGPFGALAGRVNGLCVVGEDLLIGTEAGVYAYDGKTLRPRRDISDRSVMGMVVQNGLLYLSSNRGLISYDPATGKARSLAREKGYFVAGNAGEIFFGGMYGAWRYAREAAPVRALHEYLTGFAEHDGKLYASTYYNGLWELGSGEGRRLGDGEFTCIAPAKQGVILGDGRGKLWLYDTKKGEKTELPAPVLPQANITALCNGASGLYVGTPVGIERVGAMR
jgi:hypothetical protein